MSEETDLTFVKQSGDIREYRLNSNGLRILLLEEHSSPVVTVMVSYLVGSINERKGQTGAAHMLEHMLFKGTKKYQKARGTQISFLLESTGGVLNANTNYDITNYYEMIPSDHLSLAMDIESDRMRGSLLRVEDFEHEKNVILNELERYYDSPVAELMILVSEKAYEKYPYKNPVIGWREDVKAMPPKVMKDFYDRFYWPNNAVLTVIGDFKTERVLKEISKKFESIPASSQPIPQIDVEEPAQKTTYTVDLKKEEGASYLLLADKIPGALHEDAVALDLLGQILSQGKTSRLYQELVEPGLAAAVEAGSSGTRGPGLFTTLVTLAPGIKHDDIQEKILDVFKNIASEGVHEDELRRAQNQVKAAAAYSRDGTFSIANELSHAISIGDWTSYVTYLEDSQRVSAADIQRVAKAYLSDSKMTIGRIYSKSSNEAAGTGMKPADVTGVRNHGVETETAPAEVDEHVLEEIRQESQKLREEPAENSTGIASKIEHSRFGSVDLYTLHTGARDVVSLTGSFEGAGTAYSENPVLARLTSLMLDKGTKEREKLEIAELLEEKGAQINFSAAQEYVHVNGRSLKQDAPLLIELIGEQLRKPLFDKEEFEKAKKREVVTIRHAMSSTGAQAGNQLMRALYPKGHPYWTAPFEEQLEFLEKTTIEDVRHFYDTHYGSQHMNLVIVGDFDEVEVRSAVLNAFSDWPEKEVEPLKVPGTQNEKGVRLHVPVPGKVNTDVFMGKVVPLTRKDEDFLPAYAGNYVLGGDFSARLSNIVRDQYGLTYGIRSGLSGVTEDIAGAWLVHMIVNPPLMGKGIERTMEQLKEFYENGILEGELTRKKETISGRFKIGLATTRGMGNEILNSIEMKLGSGYVDRFPDMIEALTVNQVNEAIRRYYDPEDLFIVTAGRGGGGN